MMIQPFMPKNLLITKIFCIKISNNFGANTISMPSSVNDRIRVDFVKHTPCKVGLEGSDNTHYHHIYKTKQSNS